MYNLRMLELESLYFKMTNVSKRSDDIHSWDFIERNINMIGGYGGVFSLAQLKDQTMLAESPFPVQFRCK